MASNSKRLTKIKQTKHKSSYPRSLNTGIIKIRPNEIIKLSISIFEDLINLLDINFELYPIGRIRDLGSNFRNGNMHTINSNINLLTKHIQ